MIEINTLEEFEYQILNSSSLVVCIFSASWCGPCKNLKESIQRENVETMYPVKFLYIDVDKNEMLAERFSVRSLPTQIFIKKQKVLDEIQGFNWTGLMKRLRSFSSFV